MRMVLRMKLQKFVLAAEIPCEWKFATKFASDCECDGLVHSGLDIFGWGGGLAREGVGAKQFGMSLETQENKSFLAGYPGTLPRYCSARKVRKQKKKKNNCVQFSSRNSCWLNCQDKFCPSINIWLSNSWLALLSCKRHPHFRQDRNCSERDIRGGGPKSLRK